MGYITKIDKDFGILNLLQTEDSPIVGVNGKPIISVDHLIDLHDINSVNEEICGQLILEKDFKRTYVSGEQITGISGELEDTILFNLPEDSMHRQKMRNMNKIDRRKYMYYAMNLSMPWSFSKYLMSNHFLSNSCGIWECPEDFPKTVGLINRLPFKNISRVVIYGSFPRSGVPIHRDKPSQELSHHINLFPKATRPVFVWDSINNLSHSLSSDSKSCVFNTFDYHGVKPEGSFNYTLRIDGEYTDAFLSCITQP